MDSLEWIANHELNVTDIKSQPVNELGGNQRILTLHGEKLPGTEYMADPNDQYAVNDFN